MSEKKLNASKINGAILYKAIERLVFSLFPNDEYIHKKRLNYNRDLLWSKLKKTSSSGLPYLKKKGDCWSEFCDIIDLIQREEILKSEIIQDAGLPNIIFTVVQPGKSKLKTRSVYCPPFLISVLEMIFG